MATATCTITKSGRHDEFGRALSIGQNYTGDINFVMSLFQSGFCNLQNPNLFLAATNSDVVSFRDDAAGPIVINNGSVLQLLGGVLTAANKSGSVPISGYSPDISGNMLLFPPPPNKAKALTINFRISVTYVTGSLQNCLLSLRRADDSLIAQYVTSRSPDTGTNVVTPPSYIFGITDPFITGGVKFVLENNSGSAITLSGFVQVLCTWTNVYNAINPV